MTTRAVNVAMALVELFYSDHFVPYQTNLQYIIYSD
jgi:hypothetical protein